MSLVLVFIPTDCRQKFLGPYPRSQQENGVFPCLLLQASKRPTIPSTGTAGVMLAGKSCHIQISSTDRITRK